MVDLCLRGAARHDHRQGSWDVVVVELQASVGRESLEGVGEEGGTCAGIYVDT